MALIERVPKSGRNDHYGYDFVTEADITEAVRTEMARRQLMIVPSAIDARSEVVGEKGMRLFTQKTRFTVMDGESGESFSFDLYGQGYDSQDKGPYKATTGAVKYALLKLFLIPTGDDPERDAPRNATASPPSGASGLKTKVLRKPAPPPAPSGSVRASHDRSLVYPFGNSKGQPISDVDDKSLVFWVGVMQKELDDKTKSKWHGKVAQQLATVQAEQRYRQASADEASGGGPAGEPPPLTDEDAPY